VMIDGVWIGYRNFFSRICVTHGKEFAVTVFNGQLGSVFQQSTFHCFMDHDLAGWRQSHTNLLLFWLLNTRRQVKVMLQPKSETNHSTNLFILILLRYQSTRLQAKFCSLLIGFQTLSCDISFTFHNTFIYYV
jgi:hypothetical protein